MKKTMTDAQRRIEKLRREINRHRYLYHVRDKQEISEAALDSLKHELTSLEQRYPELITPDSPTQRIGGKPLAKFVKVQHAKPVLSLSDVFSYEELADWEDRNAKLLGSRVKSYYCELKFDGLTAVLTYEKGLLLRGATRGDGYVGEDVTQNLKTMESIPLVLNLETFPKAPTRIEIRGEAVMTKKEFDRLNRDQEKRNLPLYANPRNVAAGSIRQLDPKITATRGLVFFAFELITDLGQKTHEQSHEFLAALGFKTSTYNKSVPTLAGVEQYLTTWEEKRKSLPYNTDGAVIVVNDMEQERRLGSVGKSERWMAAYKFAAEQATTRVKDIIIQVGRTGALTPVAILEPVLLAGTTVSRATLHNEDEIKRLDIRIGDTVIVQKAGDIIPDVVQVLPKLRTGHERVFHFPKKCPKCNAAVTRAEGEAAYYCTNPQCFAQRLEMLIHFVSKKGFDIEGLGEKIVEQLMNAGLVVTGADFFTLSVDDLKPLERFAEKSADNLVKAIASSKRIAMPKFIYALGIRHVGEETARTLAQEFRSIEKLIDSSREDLEHVSDVGPKVAASIAAWFQDKGNKKLLNDLQRRGVRIEQVARAAGGVLKGKKFVITGTLSSPREEIAEKIRRAGGSVSSSVSSQTDYVVAGADPGSKYDKTKKLGVAIISDTELDTMLLKGK